MVTAATGATTPLIANIPATNFHSAVLPRWSQLAMHQERGGRTNNTRFGTDGTVSGYQCMQAQPVRIE